MTRKVQGESITRDVDLQCRAANFAPESLNREKRTVDLTWTTGAKVIRGFWERYYEELSLDPGDVRMGRLESGAPLLDAHEQRKTASVIGVVVSASIADGRGVATVRFAKDAASDVIFEKVADGIMGNVSVGYRVHKLEKQEESINEIPIYRATDWEPLEISMVPIGADAGATVRGEAGDTNRCEFIGLADLEQKRMADKNKTITTPTAVPAPVAVATVTDAQRAEIATSAAGAERERLGVITRLADSLELPKEFVQEHVKAGTSADAVRSAAFDLFEKRKAIVVTDKARPDIVPGEDVADKRARGMANWMITRAGLSRMVKNAAKIEGETVDLDPGEFRGMTLMDMARNCLEASGKRVSGMASREMVGIALTHRAGLHTTSDFPVILENVMHKVLQASYAITPDKWTRFCKRGSVTDFRVHNRYRLGAFGVLDDVEEGGEFAKKAIADGEKETISASTKGNIIVLSRQAIINDDMGAFSDLAVRYGRSAAFTIEKAVFAELQLNAGLGPVMSDGNTLFHATHNNIGAGAALSVNSIDADAVLMAGQLDPNGNEILDLDPEILLVPRGLLGDALVLNDSQFDVDSASRKAQVPNKVRGMYGDIVGTARLTDATRRYSFANPAQTPTFEVVFLEGQESPFLEMKEGWAVDGIEWKARLDFGVGGVDFRGAVTNAGA